MAAIAENNKPSLPLSIAMRTGRIIDNISQFSGQISGILMLLSCLCIFYGIITRIFNQPTAWEYEIVIYIMMWFVSLALSFAQQQKANINMDLFVSHLSAKRQETLLVAVYFI